jgi:hypothetical protein
MMTIELFEHAYPGFVGDRGWRLAVVRRASFSVLAQEFDGAGYRFINGETSFPSARIATQRLHETMLQEHARILQGLPPEGPWPDPGMLATKQ